MLIEALHFLISHIRRAPGRGQRKADCLCIQLFIDASGFANFRFAYGNRRADDRLDSFNAQGIANHILQLEFREAPRTELFEKKCLVPDGVELSVGLKYRDGLDVACNLRIRRLDAEFLCLMLHHQPVPDELVERPILILRHSAQIFKKTELPQSKRKLKIFDLAFDVRLRKLTAVDGGQSSGSKLSRIRRIVEPDEGNNCQHGDE